MTNSWPSIHVLCFGDFGSGKSNFAKSFPAPILVFTFDPYGNEQPYLARGRPSELWPGDVGQQCRSVYALSQDVELIRIEYFHETDFHEPTFSRHGKNRDQMRVKEMNPVAYKRFLMRLATLHREYDQWQTVVLDPVTSMEIAARNWARYELNPNTEEPRQWYNESKERLESVIMTRFGGLPMNVVVIAHIDEDKDEVSGTFVRNPSAPGKLRKQAPTAFGEVYHSYIRFDKGQATYLLQTRPSQMFSAKTHIDAPDPCWPTYEALWENYR